MAGRAALRVRADVRLRSSRADHQSAAMIAHDKLERLSCVIHVMVNRIDDMSECITELRMRSRDFH